MSESVRTFDPLKGNLVDFMELVKEEWQFQSWGWNESAGSDEYGDYTLYEVSTGGWSDNESLISDLMANEFLWNLIFVDERAGGHYRFKVYR